MKTLYFIRHGQSLANTGAKSMPDREIPLTELGLQQAHELAEKWQNPPNKIYCSQMLRAQQTAQAFCDKFQLIAKTGSDTDYDSSYDACYEILPWLNEFGCLGYATVEGMMGKERAVLAKKYWQTADLEHRDSHDADSFADFLVRVDNFISQLDEFEDNSLFCGHGIWVGLLAWRLMGCHVQDNADMQRFRQFQTAMPMANTVVYRLLVSGEVRQLQWVDMG